MSKLKGDKITVFVEGGGDYAALKSELRRAFAEFFKKTILGEEKRPKVVACGGRQSAYDDFCTAIRGNKNAMLLVDSETPINPSPTVNVYEPWKHLKESNNWDKPPGASDINRHLMVQCMESWFIADWNTMASFFGQGFRTGLKPSGSVETITKKDVYTAIERASDNCKTKAQYGKGPHSFKILALVDSSVVLAASPWAKRFIDELDRRMS